MQTLYDILKVQPDAPPEIIRAAYKAMSNMYHPDKNGGDPDANEQMQRINDAYKVLSDPKLRAQYDDELRASHSDHSDAARSNRPPVEEESFSQANPPNPKPPTKSNDKASWWPILFGAATAKLIGALGSVVAIGIYYWIRPRKGIAVASLAAVASGAAVSIGAAYYFQQQVPFLTPAITAKESSRPLEAQKNSTEAIAEPAIAPIATESATPTPFRSMETIFLEQESQRSVERYPYLDTPAGEKVVDLILKERDALIAKGQEPYLALRQATDSIAPRFDPLRAFPPVNRPVAPPSATPRQESNVDTAMQNLSDWNNRQWNELDRKGN